MDHYRILQIEESASREDVRAAYLRLVQENHPDRFNADSQPSLGASKETFKRIQTAFEVLYDSERRAEYDRLRLPPLVHPATAHAPYARRTRRASATLVRRRARKPSLIKRLFWLGLSLLVFVLVVISLRFLILLPGTSRTQLPPLPVPMSTATARNQEPSPGNISHQSQSLPPAPSPTSARPEIEEVAIEMAPAEASIQEPPLAHAFAADVFTPAVRAQDQDAMQASALADDVMLDSPSFYNQRDPPRLLSAPTAGPFPGEAASFTGRPNEGSAYSSRPRGKRGRKHRVRTPPDLQAFVQPASGNQYSRQPARPSATSPRSFLPSSSAFNSRTAGFPAMNWTTSPHQAAGSADQQSPFGSPSAESTSNWGTGPNAFSRPIDEGLSPAQPTLWGTAPQVFNGSPDDVFQPGRLRPFERSPASSGLMSLPFQGTDTQSTDRADRLPDLNSAGR